MSTNLKTNNSNKNNATIYKQLNDLNKLKKKKDDEILIKKRRNNIIFLFLFLLCIGFFNFYSTISHQSSEIISKKILKFSIILSISLVAGIITFSCYKHIKKKNFRILIFVLGMITFLVVAFFPNPHIFPTINGGKGWIRLFGFSLQVTEIFKIAYVILLAGLLARGKDSDDKFSVWKNLIHVGIYLLIFFFLLYSLRDLGTGIHYLLITLFLVFISDISNKIAYGGLITTFLAAPLVLFLAYSLSSGYKHHRIKIYLEGLLHNNYDRFDAFQIYQSLVGIGTGGLFGKGYGNGIQKYNYIPEIETDFAIATLAEETGLIGIILLLLTFLMFFILIMNIAENSKTYFGKYLVAGIAGYFITQVVINISVAVGLLPVFGIPLPFISSGGSSLLALSIAIALVLRVNNEGLNN